MAVLCFLVCGTLSIHAQNAGGTITGVVRDSSGAAIGAAQVTVANQDTGLTAAVLTQSDGSYIAPNLLPGYYRVTTEAAGFKRTQIQALKLDVGTTATQDIFLELGQVTEAITVSGQKATVDVTSGTVGHTVNMTSVLELPLSDRTVFGLINLVPGAYFVNTVPASLPITQYSLGGSRGQQGLALLDGVINSRGGVGAQNIEMQPPADAIQEFRVQTNNLSAEFGRSGGGVVNAVTKSGTNAFHGNFYEFLRNDKFDAAGWGNNSKPKLRRNTFGGTVGGPIRENSTFFFYSYENLIQRQGQFQTYSNGLPEWRQGDFSTATRDAGGRAESVPIFDPDSGTGTFSTPRGTVPFAGNVIPASRLDPVAVKALAFIPNGNQTPVNSFNFQGNYQAFPSSEFNQTYHVGRIDHEFATGSRVFFRYIAAWPWLSKLPETPGFGAARAGSIVPYRLQNYALNLTHLFSPSFFLSVTAGVNRVYNRNQGGCAWCGINYPEQLGLRGVPGPGFPQFGFGGGLVPVDTIGGGPDRFQMVTNTDFVANFTKVRGTHTYKFGAQYNRYNNNTGANVAASGNWTFDGRFTRGVDANGTPIANTGINLADFLLGRVTSVTVQLTPSLGRRAQYYGAYFQDDWRVSSKLTLNLGIRYGTQNPTYSNDNRMSNFDPFQPNPRAGTGDIPAGALGVTTFQDRNGMGKYLWNWRKNGFEPRFGFAYRLFGNNETVIRGGFGLFFAPPTPAGTNNAGLLGFGMNYTVNHPVPFRLVDGVPNGVLNPIPESELTPTFGHRGTAYEQSGINFYYPNRPSPYTENVNLTLQHLWKGVLFETAYLGNFGRHLAGQPLNINLVPKELLARTDIPIRLRRPFTIFAGDQAAVTSLEDNYGISNYHAFTLRAERRWSNGVSFTLAYTLSKWIDNISFMAANARTFGDNDGPQDIYNRAGEKSLATNHIPHRLVVAPIIELPFGKGRRWMNRTGVTDGVLGGWEVSFIGTMQSGSPFGVNVLNGGRDLLGDPAGTLRPDLIGDPNSPNKGEPAAGVRGIQWINPAAFANPARYTFGNAARTVPGILSPGLYIYDVMLGKNFRFKERYRLQFRAEMLDAFNTPRFLVDLFGASTVPTVYGGGNFGVITSIDQYYKRNIQFALKLYW